MAGKSFLIINCILFILSQVTNVECSKLNVPRVLLPIFSDFSTNFTLEVTEGGCYKWTTSRLDLVQIIPIDMNPEHECCSQVVVAAISKEQTRNTAIVLAEEFHTGQVLRCDVIVDIISTLNIVTTTRELFMEEAPEAFEVRAYDDQGNEFTTLEGIQFDWTLTCYGTNRPGSNDNMNVLRFITFRDSPYETPHSVEHFEEIGVQGHIILLEGVKTGSAKVSVRVPYNEYKDVKTVEVPLMVVANLIIEPADVYILRGDVIQYRIIQVKHGRLEEINLPSSQYFLEVEDGNIGTIDKKTGYLTGLNIGKTRVHLHDRNVNDNDSGLKLPTATVSIVLPAYITLNLFPHRNWAIIFGEQHDLIVEAFASNDHKIHLGDGAQFKTDVDENYFSVIKRSFNGSWLTGLAMQQGIANVQSNLLNVVSNKLGKINLDAKLVAKAEILIFPKIILVPHEVVLPWDPFVRPKYDIEIKATGGDNKFMWITSNRTIGVVTQTGLVRTQWYGQFDVCAMMSRNHHNRNCARVYIVPPMKLEIVEYVMEAEIGKPLFLHVALYTELRGSTNLDLIPFLKCKEIPLKVKISEHNFIYNKSATIDPVGSSCTTVAIIGLSIGLSQVTVSYVQDDILLEDIVTVSAYRPLELLHPSSGESVLAVGTSRYLVFTGGPRPWASRPSEHIVQIVSSNSAVKALDVTEVFKVPGDIDTYVVHVSCKQLGESEVTLTIWNKPLFSNCRHQQSVASANIICGKPRTIQLRPDLKLAERNNCPMDLSSDKVIIQSYKNVELSLIVLDENGKKFDNISSFQIKWEINPKEYGSVIHRNNAFSKNITHGNVHLPFQNYQIFVPQSRLGTIDLIVTVTGYQSEFLDMQHIRAENPPFLSLEEVKTVAPVISTMITFHLVDDTQVVPNRTSIYNHHLNKVYLSVQQGSGFYELSLSSHTMADVKYKDASREIEIVPRQNGELHVNMMDLCLTSVPASIIVNIVSVNSIIVEMPDKVEVGKHIHVVVKFFDELDELMPLPKLEYLDVKYAFEDNIVGIKLKQQNKNDPWPVGEMHYILTGTQLGDTKIVFSAGRSKSSLPMPVHVFSPIRIQPRNMTLIIGSYLELVILGGPQPDTNIEFKTLTENIVEVSTQGLVHGLMIGRTKIEARSVGIHPSTGQKIIHSEDSIEVHVIPLSGIKITMPLTRFVRTTSVPAWVTTVPENLTPLVLGTITHLKFLWSNPCSDIIVLHGTFHEIGVRYEHSNQVSIQVEGLKPGKCSIELKVLVPGTIAGLFDKQEVFYKSVIEIEVYEELLLLQPVGFSGRSILLAPFTKLQLRTNKDGLGNMKYSLQNENDGLSNNNSLSIPNSIVTITQTGLLQSYGSLGRVMVLLIANDEHGMKQTLNLVIEVKSIHYMMINVVTDWIIHPDEHVTSLPVGSEFLLETVYHDNSGVIFTAAQSEVRYTVSRTDLLEVKRSSDNTSFHVSVNKAGSTVIKFWTEGMHKTVYYMKFSGAQVNKPYVTDLITGDILCLWSPIIDLVNKKGTWSADSGSIPVNQSTGISHVINSHHDKSSVKYSLTPAAKLHFNIEPIAQIEFVTDKIETLSSSIENQPFSVPILLTGIKTKNIKSTNVYPGWMCQSSLKNEIKYFPFSCEIYFSNMNVKLIAYEVFEVSPAFNEKLGYYACNFIPNEITANTSLIDSNVTLRATSDNGVRSPSIELNFIPGVFVQNKELHISEAQYYATLTVVGLPDVLKLVKVIATDSSLLQVNDPEWVSPNMVNYDIELIDYHWKLNELQDLLSVTVKSYLTKQHIKVPIKTHIPQEKLHQPVCMSRMTGSPLGNFVVEYKETFVILCSLLILLFATFYVYSHYIMPTINVNVDQTRNPYIHPSQPQMLSPGLNSSPSRTYGYSPINRTMSTSDQLQHNYSGDNSLINRSFGSPDIRRNKSFL